MVRDLCIKSGLMVRGIRDTIVMSPPLVISHAEIDQLVGTIRGALDEAAPALRALQAQAADDPRRLHHSPLRDRAGAMIGRASSHPYPPVRGAPSRSDATLTRNGREHPSRPESRTGTGSR